MEKTSDRQASLLVVNSLQFFSSRFLLISILKSGKYISILSRLHPENYDRCQKNCRLVVRVLLTTMHQVGSKTKQRAIN